VVDRASNRLSCFSFLFFHCLCPNGLNIVLPNQIWDEFQKYFEAAVFEVEHRTVNWLGLLGRDDSPAWTLARQVHQMVAQMARSQRYTQQIAFCPIPGLTLC
jgi:hypothetical protein